MPKGEEREQTEEGTNDDDVDDSGEEDDEEDENAKLVLKKGWKKQLAEDNEYRSAFQSAQNKMKKAVRGQNLMARLHKVRWTHFGANPIIKAFRSHFW